MKRSTTIVLALTPVLALYIPILVFEIGNLTGFSWKRFNYISDAELIDAAIRHSYPNIYSNAAELRSDYGTFTPEARYWGSWIPWEMKNGVVAKLLGLTRYQVRLPEDVVVLSVEGDVRFSREIPIVAVPDYPEQGIVGTVQYGPPGYEVMDDFSIAWTGNDSGTTFISEHCFSASVNSTTAQSLIVSPARAPPRTIRVGYGYYLVAVTGDSTYARMRISKAEFMKSRTCSVGARRAWPNVGGWIWKR